MFLYYICETQSEEFYFQLLDFVVMTRDANETQDVFVKDGYR